ncbi:SDR family oxidoreductase [Williamsia sterculiae]|uniref:Short-chain dehydrogenase n=1 Tax=Williamsia sterculiae TaxID=1344003 RepID=A0A1N7FD74_9NOCA|nr:SDR family oxidoreductase [Williamsia sterculiae]SIR98338.1 Short-chain dehydrogenase [Williamsia sterculiae]
MTRTALVTGASSGIGRSTAQLLRDKGYRVIGTSRDPDAIPDGDRLEGVEYLALELGDPTSMESCAAAAGPVDILVNNAGESQSGPIEELPMDALDRLFTLNVLGPVRMTQLLLPGMRERRFGRVVMVGSMLASFPLAYRSSYVATKAAIKGFATASRAEVAPFGIAMITVEPGSINTGISTRRTKYVADDSVYHDEFHRVIDALDRNEAGGIPAEQVAETIVAAIESSRPRAFYAVGSRAPIVFALRRILTEGGVNRVVNAMHGLRR